MATVFLNSKPRARRAKNFHDLPAVVIKRLETLDLPTPEREFRFHPTRRWRADLAYPKLKILIEVEGGTFIRGRHTRPIGYANDCEKYNNAAALGYLVFRLTSSQINKLESYAPIVKAIRRALA